LQADSQLAGLHAAWRKNRFRQLMANEDHRALFGRLLMSPTARPIAQEAARFMLNFAQKAEKPGD